MAITLRTNASQATDVIVGDLGIVIPNSGGSETLDGLFDLDSIRLSRNVRTLATDDAHGAGSSTIIVNDGSVDIDQDEVLEYLNTFNVSARRNATTSSPSVTNDATEGYEPGSVWVNTTDDDYYSCVDSSSGAAIWKNITAAIDDLPAVSGRRTGSFTGSSSFTDVTLNATDVENDTSIIEHDNTNTDRILIKETGLYLIGWFCVVLPTGGPSTIEGRVRIDDTTVIPNSYASVDEDNEDANLSNVCIVELTSGEYITLQLLTSVGTETVRPDLTFFAVRQRGIKGDKGDTGAGSSITIEDEGGTVTGGPHDTINFVGSAVSVTNAGGGTADVTISGGVFGQDYQTATSTGRSTTTSTTFQTKVTLTTGSLTGTYRVGWCAVVDQSRASDAVQVQLLNTTDAAVVGVLQEHEPKDSRNRIHVGGFAEVVFSGAAKSFSIQWREQRGSTAGIQDARIEIWRVS